jgi:hypothetical protein
MLKTLIGFFVGPWSFLISASVRHVSMPHMPLALTILISSSCTWMRTGSDDAPSSMMPSYPANFNSGPQKPPMYESVKVPVEGDLVAATVRFPSGAGVPVSVPVNKYSLLSGPSASVPFLISLMA